MMIATWVGGGGATGRGRVVAVASIDFTELMDSNL
jgi:hypothetical protein